MLQQIEMLCQEHHLKHFYAIALPNLSEDTDPSEIDLLVSIAPFIRQFHSKFVNYYGLAKRPAMNTQRYENRLTEFYSELCSQVLTGSPDQTIGWLLDQNIEEHVRFFPDRPIVDNYQDIMRSLNVLIELLKTASIADRESYEKLYGHVRSILSPGLDDDFEAAGKTLLMKLKQFDAHHETVDSPTFENLKKQIEQTNALIRSRLMSNNTFVSLLQQLSEINKALKTIRKTDFRKLLSESSIEQMWNGLREHGYTGDDNYLYGDYPQHSDRLKQWLESTFPAEFNELVAQLEQAYCTPELPTLNKEVIPEAVHLYAIKLIGTAGLRTNAAIKLVLSYHSRFVDKMVRDGAYQALKQNADQVQDYFLTALGNVTEYDQMLLIADKHDSIFQQIKAESLVKTFGSSFREPLKLLDKLSEPDGILLGNFIRSAYMKLPDSEPANAGNVEGDRLLLHFHDINQKLTRFKLFVENRSKQGFISLIRMWGLNYIVSWALADYEEEERLFSLVIKAATNSTAHQVTTMDRVIPMQDIITLLSKEPDARDLIQKLMTYLLNSKISFDYRLFSSLFQVVAQRQQQLQGGISIRDGFSEQRGYTQKIENDFESDKNLQLQDPHVFHPIVVFLIAVLHMKFINIPKDAFVETDISLYLNSLAGHQTNPELGYQMYLAHQLISCIPYIKDFSSQHETIIRKLIADLDESYKRENVLFHYHRIKIHRAPSKLDLDFCLEMLEGLSTKTPDDVLANLIRLMRGIGDEAIPDLEEYFGHYQPRLKTLGRFLKAFKNRYPQTAWQEIAEFDGFTKVVRDLPGIDSDSARDIIALVKLVNALSYYWTQRVNDRFLDAYLSESEQKLFKSAPLIRRLDLVREKRIGFQAIVNTYSPQLEPYQHIFLKRHVIQGDWNFDFFGFWPHYKETKFEAYNADRKLSQLEKQLLQTYARELSETEVKTDQIDDTVIAQLQRLIDCLQRIMTHLVDEGLAPSKYFLDTIDVLKLDQLTVSQLHDILGILYHRELAHIDSFIANTFGHFPAQITKALGRENLDFGLEKLTVSNEELLFPLVQETVLGNIIAGIHPIHLLEDHLERMLKQTGFLKSIAPSQSIFADSDRPANRLSPVYYGYKSYALQTLAMDGFNVPDLETIPVSFYKNHPQYTKNACSADYKSFLITQILKLEQKTGKKFDFNFSKLNESQQAMVKTSRQSTLLDENRQQLLLSARSGSYRSMPGILGTVLNIGYMDILDSDPPSKNNRLDLDSYRMFLSTFGNVVLGINEIHFSRIVEESKKTIESHLSPKIKWEDLNDTQIIHVIKRFKNLIESHNQSLPAESRMRLDWNDPLELLAISTIGVWNSWNSSAAKRLRAFLDISPDWKTPVTLMEMKQADKNRQSFSAILFSGDPQGKIDRPHGDLLFGRPGEDIASGLASEGEHLEYLEIDNPKLYHQIADLLEKIKVNKGHVNVDVEMVGEFDPQTEQMELFVVQERQMPLGTRGESEDFRLTPTDVLPVATGKGVNGGVQHGVLLDGINQEYYQLRDTVKQVRETLGAKNKFHGPGIFLLMKYVTPEEALKMNIEGVDGVITTKIGKSSHASIAAKRDGKLFVCEASVTTCGREWFIGKRKINLADSANPDLFTIVGNPKSVSPYSGNIYDGALPLTRVLKKR